MFDQKENLTNLKTQRPIVKLNQTCGEKVFNLIQGFNCKYQALNPKLTQTRGPKLQFLLH